MLAVLILEADASSAAPSRRLALPPRSLSGKAFPIAVLVLGVVHARTRQTCPGARMWHWRRRRLMPAQGPTQLPRWRITLQDMDVGDIVRLSNVAQVLGMVQFGRRVARTWS